MGCQQSDPSNISVPISYNPALYNSNNPNETTNKKKTDSNTQVNDMPNDQYHFRWFDGAKKLCTQMRLQQAQQIAELFFKNGFIDEAIEIYQKIISTSPNYKHQIEGLGLYQLTVSYYEWYIYRWYNQKKLQQKIKSSPYDALSLCYSLIMGIKKYSSDMKKGLVWYQSMVNKYPQNIGIVMGYANLLANTASYDEALKMYDRIILLKPQFVNAYACKGIISEYKRINLVRASQMATKILQLQKQNPYADFILARNNKDIDQKIQKLKQASLKHPQYSRIVNQIGICYGGTKKDYDQAIQWYKKCIEKNPEYYSSYNNIGVNNQLKKNYDEARIWYYKAVQLKFDYAAPHDNLSDVYIQLGWTNQQIEQQIGLHQKINKAKFCWQIGKAFYNKKGTESVNRAIYWQQKSVSIDPTNYDVWNSLGISYDEKGECAIAIEKYLKCAQLNPQYQSAYYNIAIAYKTLNRLDQCQKYYLKAVQVNPKYSYAWNNLGNIHKNKEEYQQAIQYYQHAIQYNSTYTLALANLGICLLKVGKYKQAFTAFSKAKDALPNDNNNLSQGNKTFLKDQLNNFDKEGQKWKKTGSITDQQKQSLKQLIQQFQNKFKSIATAIAALVVPTQKIFQPQILEIIKIIKEDKFELSKIEQIFELVQTIFHEDEEYFHIIPLLIIEKFTTDVFQKKKPIMQSESQLKEIMKKISKKVTDKQTDKPSDIVKNIELKLTQSQATNQQVNLFKETTFFNSYLELYIKVNKVNTEAKKSYTDFTLLVEQVRKKSNGKAAGISTKIPTKQSEQFKVMLRIMQKMFKKQIDQTRTTNIINSINENLKQVKSPKLDVVVKEIMNAWNNQISNILKERSQKQIETKFSISDLIRGKCIYNSLEDIFKAVRVVDNYCKTMEYQIVELDNRLMKQQTQDVVFKIRIENAVCELQLAMKQDQMLTHLDHCVYEILRSPLGVIFGSYLFMSKDVKYPLAANCKDIAEKLSDSQAQDMKLVKACAEYVFHALQTIRKDS